MRIRIASLAAAGALALTAVGAAPALAHSTDREVQVTATKDHRLHLQTDVPAGAVEFRLRGPEGENFQLAMAKGSAGPQQLVDDDALLSAKGDPRGIERDFVAVGGVPTGHSLWVRLQPGTYYAIDTAAEKATVAEVVTLTVQGDGATGRLPSASGTITAIRDMDWSRRPGSIPGHGVLRFVNASSDYHFVELARLRHRSTTLTEVKTALKKQDESIFFRSGVYDTGVLTPGSEQESGYHLKRGTYAVLCWWPDEHGVPHALMGMVRLIRVD